MSSFSHYFGVQTTHIETTNPFAHFVGEEVAPTHVCYVDGRLHLVQVGWSQREADDHLKEEIEAILWFPDDVETFELSEVIEIRRAVAKAERKSQMTVKALGHMMPTLAREIRRIAGNRVWSAWAYDTVQTDLRLALEASVSAVGPDTPRPNDLDEAYAMEKARSIRHTI